MKKYTRFASTIAVSGVMSLSLAGAALADSNTTITGPNDNGSNNTVVINDGSDVTMTTVNATEVSTSNVQLSATGNASASNNTTTGDVTTGDASNNNTTTTTVSNNPGMGGTTGGGTTGGGATGGNGGTTGGTTGGGSVLGASTGTAGKGGAGILPVTGATIPVDVSALRALYHAPSATTPTKALVQNTSKISGTFLGVAALLSLLSAIGTSLYTNRRERLLTK
jgi:hypothetical protein